MHYCKRCIFLWMKYPSGSHCQRLLVKCKLNAGFWNGKIFWFVSLLQHPIIFTFVPFSFSGAIGNEGYMMPRGDIVGFKTLSETWAQMPCLNFQTRKKLSGKNITIFGCLSNTKPEPPGCKKIEFSIHSWDLTFCAMRDTWPCNVFNQHCVVS